MKKLIYIFLVPLFFAACDDNAETIEVPTEIYSGDKVNIDIEGINSDVLVNPSVTFSNGSTVTINNVIDVERSVIAYDLPLGSDKKFKIETKTARDTATIEGVLTNGIVYLTGTVDYTRYGVSRKYLNKTLIINGNPSTEKSSATITFEGNEDEPDQASIALKGIVTGSEDDEKEFVARGTLLKIDKSRFSIRATSADKKVAVALTGTINKGILSITIVFAPVM